MDIVTVVNRTSRTVEGTFDGRPIVLAPHAEVPMLANAAEKVKEQNPLMGSEDPADPRSPTFLVGIKEWKDDISPIEQSNAEERFAVVTARRRIWPDEINGDVCVSVSISTSTRPPSTS